MRIKSLIGLVALFSLLLGCQSKQENAMTAPPAVPVVAVTPTMKDLTLYLESIGSLEPSILMEVKPQIEGTLMEVLVKEGDWVAEGTPLFKIDAKPYAMKVQEGEAQLAMNKANLRAAEKKLSRIRPLAQKDLVSQTEWDDLEAEVDRFHAAILLDEARLNHATLDLEHCTLYAPTAGRLGKLDAHPGRLVARGESTPLATISKMDPLLVEFTLTEKEFPKIQKEFDSLEIKTLCGTDTCATGKMTFLDNHFDSQSGLLLVRGKVENREYKLKPGQGVQVRIPIGIKEKTILIPQKAIRYNQEGPFIYVVQPDQSVALRQLILGDEQESDQVVLGGLEPTEQVIVEGHLRLSPGIKVDVKS